MAPKTSFTYKFLKDATLAASICAGKSDVFTILAVNSIKQAMNIASMLCGLVFRFCRLKARNIFARKAIQQHGSPIDLSEVGGKKCLPIDAMHRTLNVIINIAIASYRRAVFCS